MRPWPRRPRDGSRDPCVCAACPATPRLPWAPSRCGEQEPAPPHLQDEKPRAAARREHLNAYAQRARSSTRLCAMPAPSSSSTSRPPSASSATWGPIQRTGHVDGREGRMTRAAVHGEQKRSRCNAAAQAQIEGMAAGTHRRSALVDEEQGGGSPFQQKEMHVVPAASRVRDHEIEGGDEDVDDRSHGGRYDLRALQGARSADEHQRRLTQPIGHCSRSHNFFNRHRRSVSHQGREIPKLQISVEQRRAQAAPSPREGPQGSPPCSYPHHRSRSPPSAESPRDSLPAFLPS